MIHECSVYIATRTDEGTSEERVRGKFQKASEGFLVSYVLRGDDVSVRADGRSFHMKRSGETAIEAEFTALGQSRMGIYLGDLRGELPLSTQSYCLIPTENGFCAQLSYFLGSGSDAKNFQLKFIINRDLEEK